MIRIPAPSGGLADAIDQEVATWRSRAKTKTTDAVAAGRVEGSDGIWSEIKGVFIRAQRYKCAYCERPLPKIEEGATTGIGLEYDVEHFRPKNRVRSWPDGDVLERRAIDYDDQIKAGVEEGYVRLAFDPNNYLVSCKLCNSYYKGDRFPIYGKPDSKSVRRATLDAREFPLLLFPFGDEADEPSDYLRFEGPLVVPQALTEEYHSLRARTVIDFFELDTRESLIVERAMGIAVLYQHLQRRRARSARERALAKETIDAVLGGIDFPHTACLRAFVELYESDQALAARWYLAAQEFLLRRDRGVLEVLLATG